jgi:hypothetical protein
MKFLKNVRRRHRHHGWVAGIASPLLLAAVTALTASTAHAGFFIPKDNWMAMATYTPTELNTDIAYGLRRDLSLSFGLTRVKETLPGVTQSTPETAWRNVWIAQASYLLKRVPTHDGIGNAYVFGGPLLEQRERGGDRNAGASAGVWLDYETRRIYTRLKLHTLQSWGGDASQRWRRNEVVGQAMWAPYAADYEDVASWIGVQAKRVSGEPQTELTPYVRLFRKNWWIDAGASVNSVNRRDIFVNFMYLF